MVRKPAFYNPMSFANELHQSGYLPGPSGQTGIGTKPGANQTKPPQTTRPVQRPPLWATKPPYNQKPTPKPGTPRDKATPADQALAANRGRRQGGRTAVFAKGFQYGPRTQRGGPTPVYDSADLARRLSYRENNKYIANRLTPFVPRGR